MPVIDIAGLAKSYRVYQKKEGLLAAVRGLFRREYKEVQAVRGIDLSVVSGTQRGGQNDHAKAAFRRNNAQRRSRARFRARSLAT
jgi:ABC-type uncharacterized transport system ATPase subunit